MMINELLILTVNIEIDLLQNNVPPKLLNVVQFCEIIKKWLYIYTVTVIDKRYKVWKNSLDMKKSKLSKNQVLSAEHWTIARWYTVMEYSYWLAAWE